MKLLCSLLAFFLDYDVMSVNSILEHMIAAVKRGGQILEFYYDRPQDLEVRHKPQAGLVTQADLECERAIREYLEKQGFGDFGFIGEETQSQADQWLAGDDPVWILDPLDGTTNFVCGLDFWAVSLALVLKGQVQAGVIWAPRVGSSGMLCEAIRYQGARCNGRPIRVAQGVSLSDSVLATGFFHEDSCRVRRQLGYLEMVLDRVQGIRRLGSAAIDLALVAQGRIHGFWELGLQVWDVAAGVLIVEEAQGIVLNERGENYRLGDELLMAGAHDLVRELWKVFHKNSN